MKSNELIKHLHLYILFYFVLDILVMLVSRLQNYTYYYYIIIPHVQIILPQLLFLIHCVCFRYL